MITQTISICIFGFLVILVTYQVVIRYVFSNPSAWSEQLARYLFVWLVLIASSYIFGRREHMNIGFFIGKFPSNVKTIMEILSEVLICIFMIFVMIYGGYNAVVVSMPKMDTSLPISIGIINSVLVISGVLTLFYSICNIIDLIDKYKKDNNKLKQK